MMMIRRYVIRELSNEGLMVRPVAANWLEGTSGEYLFGDSYSDEQYDTRSDAEKAVYDFYFRMWEKEGDSMYASPRFTVIELLGFEG